MIKVVKELAVGEHISGTVVEIYAATGPEDRTEGRGPWRDTSYHLTEREATIACGGIGAMGEDGKVATRKAVRLSGERGYFLLTPLIEITANPEAAAKLRMQALAKLSPAERAALLGTKA